MNQIFGDGLNTLITPEEKFKQMCNFCVTQGRGKAREGVARRVLSDI